MRPVSPLFLRSLNGSHKRKTTITCTVPGGAPRELLWESGSIQAASGTGKRYGASLRVVPEPRADTFGLISTPGAEFNIQSGIQYSGTEELTDCFTGQLSTAPKASIFGNSFDVSLTDDWLQLSECRFSEPYAAPAATRAAAIAAVVLDAKPGTIIDIRDDGGNYSGGKVWERDRTQLITDLAADGQLEAGFDAAGVFVIRAIPILDPTASVWTFRSGEVGNILTADRSVPLGVLYNRVVVFPSTPDQTWARQYVDLEDLNNPRHRSKIGVRPYFWSSPSAMSAGAARGAGEGILQRLLAGASLLDIAAVSNPALEPGDNVVVLQSETETDPGFTELHLLDQYNLDLRSFQMAAQTRSANIAPTEDGV